MLPPFIIDQIREREEEEQERTKRPRPAVELPLKHRRDSRPPRRNDDDADRGVVIIDLSAD